MSPRNTEIHINNENPQEPEDQMGIPDDENKSNSDYKQIATDENKNIEK